MTKLSMQDDVITRSLAMFDCALWSPAKDEPPATSAVSNATPPTPLSTTTFSQSLSPSPPPPSYSLLPPIPPPLPSQPPPGYTVQDQELYLLLAAHWWNQPEAPLFCWRWTSLSALDFLDTPNARRSSLSANLSLATYRIYSSCENREYWNSCETETRKVFFCQLLDFRWIRKRFLLDGCRENFFSRQILFLNL